MQTLINYKWVKQYTAPSAGHLPEMQVQYSSAKRSNSDLCVTLSGSGQGDLGSGVTFDPCLCTVLVGVQMAGVVFSGELVCWASLDLEKMKLQMMTENHTNIFLQHNTTNLSLLSNSLSSCRLRGLPPVSLAPALSGMVGGLAGRLSGVDVKQLLGLELGRSALTGVGLILREGLVALEKQQKCFIWSFILHLSCNCNEYTFESLTGIFKTYKIIIQRGSKLFD